MSADPADPLAAIRQTFFQECDDGLAELEAGLLRMDAGETDGETVNAVFRAVHSIKGGAGAFGLESLVRFAHVFETALDHVRADRLVADAPVVAVLLRANDVLSDLVSAAREEREAADGRVQAVAAELDALAGGDPDGADGDDGMGDFDFQPVQAFSLAAPALEPAVAGPRTWRVRFTPGDALYAKANDAVLLLRELARLGEATVELDAGALPPLAELEPEAAYLAWTVTLATAEPREAIAEVFDFVDGDCRLEIEEVGASPGPAEPDVMALIAAARAATVEVAEAEPPPAEPDIMALISAARAATSQVAGPASAPPEPAPPAATAAGEPPAAVRKADAAPTIRVDLDRVDRLIDLVGELVINQAMLSQRIGEAGLARASAAAMAMDDLEQLTREIQDSVMAIRAQPVKSVFQRMPRLVRETAALTGKQVRLATDGEGTEVDKTVIERLTDPLTHMIRNSIDHGVERPEARLAAGKPVEGVVRLSARHRSGRIVIEVADDGAGINRARVREIATARGLIAPDVALTDEETDNLIFMAGFSTAETVSDVSGRGVGMDVVRRSIQALGGRISISSRPGHGSTFSLSLPLTLAVLDGMVVTVAGQTLVAPLTAIVETLKPRADNLHLVGDARVLRIRDAYLPLIDVGQALGFRPEPPPPGEGVVLLVDTEGGARAALQVDAIGGQRQVVIKSLEANYRHVPGVAAATILGDGRVALILDVDAVVGRGRGVEAEPASAPSLPLALAG